jgi:hypothetical protein
VVVERVEQAARGHRKQNSDANPARARRAGDKANAAEHRAAGAVSQDRDDAQEADITVSERPSDRVEVEGGGSRGGETDTLGSTGLKTRARDRRCAEGTVR